MRRIDAIHLALMLLALGVSYLVPFELLLFAYVVLGPAHYTTEISWLHDRKYFLPYRGLALALAAVAIAAALIDNAAWFGFVVWGALVLCALMSAASDMSAMVTAILVLSRNKDQHGPALEVFKTMWRNYVTVWDSRLAKQRYAAGNEVTIADFALYGALGRMKSVQPALVEGFADVARWIDEMAARPAFQRALKF